MSKIAIIEGIPIARPIPIFFMLSPVDSLLLAET
jgi:hypothetical protein